MYKRQWYNKQLQDSFELAENEKLKKEIGRLSASAKRSSAWSNQVEKSKFGPVSYTHLDVYKRQP